MEEDPFRQPMPKTRADSSPHRHRLRTVGAAILTAILIMVTVPATAYADDGRMVVDETGANGAVSGVVTDSNPGSARLAVSNRNQFWTTIDINGNTGVQLSPGSPAISGAYTTLGVIAPGGTAAWNAKWNARQAAQLSVRVTPYIAQTPAGGLAAALTVLTLIAKVVPATSEVVATAESLSSAALLVESALGNDLAQLLTVEGLTSGAFAGSLFDALKEPRKAEVLREALALFGVNTTKEAMENLARGLHVLQLGLLIFDLAAALINSSSSGGVLFSSAGTAALPDGPLKINSVDTFQEGVLVFFRISFTEGRAIGFGFRGANGSGWGEESHPFSSPSYGRYSPGHLSYPFNHACGNPNQYQSDVEAWIYDSSGSRSESVVIHLACNGSAPPVVSPPPVSGAPPIVSPPPASGAPPVGGDTPPPGGPGFVCLGPNPDNCSTR